MNEIELLIIELKSKKDMAISSSTKNFPAMFYKFAYLVLTHPLLIPLVNQIITSDQNRNIEYHNIVRTIDAETSTIYLDIEKYIRTLDHNNFIADQLQWFPTNRSNNTVLAFQQVWKIKNIITILKQDKSYNHNIFLKNIEKKMILLEQSLNKLQEDNEHVRRMYKVSEMGSLQKFFRICQTYDKEWYKSLRNELVKEKRDLDVMVLDVQYQGLQKCIDPVSTEKLCYDQNFDMEADKLAIQDIYLFIELELIKNSITNVDPDSIDIKIKIIAKDEEMLSVFVGEKEKPSISRKSNRGKLALFFSNKQKTDTDQLIRLLKVENFEDVINAKNDFNKLFNEYGIKAALCMKNIPSNFGNKAEITRNPKCW